MSRKTKSIISAALCVALLIGAIGGIVALVKRDTKTIGSFSFTRGALSETDGVFVSGKTSIVTEDLFECKGLKVIPDFDNTSQYQVFWYNEDEIYLGATDKMAASTKMVGSVPGAAVYARVVIYPSQIDEDGKAIKDFEIKLWDIAKYAGTLKIEVARDQAALQQDLIEDVVQYSPKMGEVHNVLVNQKNLFLSGYERDKTDGLLTEGFFVPNEEFSSLILDCSNVAIYSIKGLDSQLDICFYDAEGTQLESTKVEINFADELVVVPENSGAAVMQIVLKQGLALPRVSEYLYRELL